MNRIFTKLSMSFVIAVVALFGLATAPAIAQDRNVLIINETEHTIMEFYASNVDRESWEEDILGEDVLPVGQSVNIDIDDGSGACLFDFKAVFDDGEELVRNGIDVCSISTYRYTEG